MHRQLCSRCKSDCISDNRLISSNCIENLLKTHHMYILQNSNLRYQLSSTWLQGHWHPSHRQVTHAPKQEWTSSNLSLRQPEEQEWLETSVTWENCSVELQYWQNYYWKQAISWNTDDSQQKRDEHCCTNCNYTVSTAPETSSGTNRCTDCEDQCHDVNETHQTQHKQHHIHSNSKWCY